MDWRSMAAAALRGAGPTKAEKQAALRRAGEEYRAMKGGHRRNPSGIVKALLIGGVVVLGVKALTGAGKAGGTWPPPLPKEPNYNNAFVATNQWLSDG